VSEQIDRRSEKGESYDYKIGNSQKARNVAIGRQSPR
jgi:hypothetical protein